MPQTRLGCLALVVVAALACTGSPTPQRVTPPVGDSGGNGAPAQTGPIDAGAIAAPAPDAAGLPALVDAAAAGGRIVEVKGRGTCQTDADCELTNYQEGCCTQACWGYGSNKADLAARKAKENCAARANVPCPPPAPCPLRKTKVLAAACRKGRCVSLEQAP